MYDLEVILPVCGWPRRYMRRLKAFKKYGLLNLGNYSVNVVLLTGPVVKKKFTEDWPCDTITYTNHQTHPAPKIYRYFASLSSETANRARWYLKVDDDSITDVGGLIKYLDDNYDYRDPHYLTTHYNVDLYHAYHHVLCQMGLLDLFKTKHGHKFPHEWESSTISCAGMNSLADNDTAKRYLHACADHIGGFGDHAVAIGARLGDIPVSRLPPMSKDPLCARLSVFGGDLFHVHFVAPDIRGPWAKFRNLYFNSPLRVIDLKKNLKSRSIPTTPRSARTPHRQKSPGYF